MATDDEGKICSGCGVYIPIGQPVFFRIGNRTLCAECGQEDPLPNLSTTQQKTPDRLLPLPLANDGGPDPQLTPGDGDAHWFLRVTCQFLAIVFLVAGVIAAGAAESGWPLWAGILSSCFFFWLSATIRLLRLAVFALNRISCRLDQNKAVDPKK
jgi:hypothetical protein